MWMRRAAGFFALLFTASAALQWNDPDPVAWILAYLVAAALSVAAAMGQRFVVLNAIAGLGFGIGFAQLAGTLPGADSAAFTSFQMQSASHEEPREAIGLALCAGWSFVLAWHAWRGRRVDA